MKRENNTCKNKLYDIISRTNIELGLKTDGKTLAGLTNIFYNDLQVDNRLSKLSIEDIDEAFRLGVRLDKKDSFLNIRTFYRWSLEHKKRINEAYYEVHTMGRKPEEVNYYKQTKLLK